MLLLLTQYWIQFLNTVKNHCHLNLFAESRSFTWRSYVIQKESIARPMVIGRLLPMQSPGDEYFHRGVLDITEGLEVMGGLRWKLVLALFGAWLITFCVISKGRMEMDVF